MAYNDKSRDELAARGHELEDGQSVGRPGFSAFLRRGNEVFHPYSSYALGGESLGGAHYMLDLTVWGRE